MLLPSTRVVMVIVSLMVRVLEKALRRLNWTCTCKTHCTSSQVCSVVDVAVIRPFSSHLCVEIFVVGELLCYAVHLL